MKMSLSCKIKSFLFLSVLFSLQVLLNVSSSQTQKLLSGTPCLMTNHIEELKGALYGGSEEYELADVSKYLTEGITSSIP